MTERIRLIEKDVEEWRGIGRPEAVDFNGLEPFMRIRFKDADKDPLDLRPGEFVVLFPGETIEFVGYPFDWEYDPYRGGDGVEENRENEA